MSTQEFVAFVDFFNLGLWVESETLTSVRFVVLHWVDLKSEGRRLVFEFLYSIYS